MRLLEGRGAVACRATRDLVPQPQAFFAQLVLRLGHRAEVLRLAAAHDNPVALRPAVRVRHGIADAARNVAEREAVPPLVCAVGAPTVRDLGTVHGELAGLQLHRVVGNVPVTESRLEVWRHKLQTAILGLAARERQEDGDPVRHRRQHLVVEHAVLVPAHAVLHEGVRLAQEHAGAEEQDVVGLQQGGDGARQAWVPRQVVEPRQRHVLVQRVVAVHVAAAILHEALQTLSAALELRVPEGREGPRDASSAELLHRHLVRQRQRSPARRAAPLGRRAGAPPRPDAGQVPENRLPSAWVVKVALILLFLPDGPGALHHCSRRRHPGSPGTGWLAARPVGDDVAAPVRAARRLEVDDDGALLLAYG
mmetsp:Transcript_71953/g.222440  ORF Transcript_71953/g.222440 Transcript_71953/m.222440 type:complete len:365 (-) Transcript_71953:356-1450(-)